jgi:hypothetical protein
LGVDTHSAAESPRSAVTNHADGAIVARAGAINDVDPSRIEGNWRVLSNRGIGHASVDDHVKEVDGNRGVWGHAAIDSHCRIDPPTINLRPSRPATCPTAVQIRHASSDTRTAPAATSAILALAVTAANQQQRRYHERDED